MTADVAPALPDEVRSWYDRAGMRPDSPLRAALLTATEAAVAARDAAGGARGLSPEAERELVRRVAEAAAAGAEREVTRLARHVELRTGLALAAGYALGRRNGASAATAKAEALGGAALLAQVAELNDLAALRRHCDRTAYQQGGALACTLPPVWIRRPSR